MARTRSTRSFRAVRRDPAEFGPLLRDAGFVGTEADPVAVKAAIDPDGWPRRIHARYPDGWTCTMRVAVDGTYSITMSMRRRVSGRWTRRHSDGSEAR